MSCENDDVLAMLSSRYGMARDVATTADGVRVVAPSRGQDRDAAFERGAWAMTDGVAIWRSGEESAAGFVRKRRSHILAWLSPWITVDPSRPGQLLDLIARIQRLDDSAEPIAEQATA